jgi:hypothetical protein
VPDSSPICCAQCFEEPGIRSLAQKWGEARPGELCQFCECEGGPFIPAAALTKSFLRVVHHYYCRFNDLSDAHLRDVGDSLYLHELFEEDFPVFLSHSGGNDLLYEILNNDRESEYSATELWARQSDDSERWELGEWLDHLLPVIEVHGHSYRRAKGVLVAKVAHTLATIPSSKDC